MIVWEQKILILKRKRNSSVGCLRKIKEIENQTYNYFISFIEHYKCISQKKIYLSQNHLRLVVKVLAKLKNLSKKTFASDFTEYLFEYTQGLSLSINILTRILFENMIIIQPRNRTTIRFHQNRSKFKARPSI